MMSIRSIGKTLKAAAVVAALTLFAPHAAFACGAYPVASATDGMVSFLSGGTNLPFIGPTTTQTWEAGTLTYNSADNTLRLCDGTAWRVLNAGPAGTAVGQVQFNNALVFGADAEFVYEPTNNQLVVGAATPSGSAALEINSTNRGFLPPRMTTAQRNGIASPVEGLIVYNTTDKQMQYFDGVLWRPFGASAIGGDGSGSGSAGISCKQILADYGSVSGTYWVDPDYSGPVAAFQAYCDMTTDGGGWMLIARNNAPTTFTNFNVNWATYKAGFGNVTVNNSLGWIGNDRLYALTIGGREMQVRNNIASHTYANFSVANETNNYRLTVASTSMSQDSTGPMTYYNNMNFTTSDDDNDAWGAGNCATTYAMGWWHNTCLYGTLASNYRGQIHWHNNSAHYFVNWMEMWIR